jgi:hypothetical protein
MDMMDRLSWWMKGSLPATIVDAYRYLLDRRTKVSFRARGIMVAK